MEEDLIFSKGSNKLNINEIWENAMNHISGEMTAISFDVWIKTIEPVEIKGNTLVLATPSLSSKKVLTKNYKTIITNGLNKAHSALTNVEFVVGSAEEELNDNQEAEAEDKDEESSVSSFNPKYTFDNFVIGASNQFVAAAAKNVASNPGSNFNPLFIYGGVGLGKTHLLHAIGNYITEHNPKKRVVYVTCNKFTNDLVNNLKEGKKTESEEFRKKYRTADVLIIDDIQFIINRTATQTEFFNIFNEMHEAGKQIVISSDKPPKDINPLEERLRSRFEWGLLADIGVPDMETKIAILMKKAQIEHYNIPHDVVEYIAGAQTTNIRTLEGMLARVVFYSSLMGESIVTMETAREALKDIAMHNEEEVDAGTILNGVCKFYNIEKNELLSRKRTKEVALARQVAMYLISDMMPMPLESVGNIFGKDHSTVIYAKSKVQEDMKKSKKFATEINDIKLLIQGK